MIYITGDTHGNFSKFSIKNFPKQKHMNKEEDYVIITGDFGGVWDNSKNEKYWLNWLENKNFTILFVDGNHENFDLLKTYPVEDFCGGKAHKIRSNIYHLMRGEVYTIQGKTFYAFGGAASHDIDVILEKNEKLSLGKRLYLEHVMHYFWRRRHVDYWEDEVPTLREMVDGLGNLSTKAKCSVDYIITHDAPLEVAERLGFEPKNSYEGTTPNYLSKVVKNCYFKEWFFGHYHLDTEIKVKDNYYRCLYNDIIALG